MATLELSDHGRGKKTETSQAKNPLGLSFVSPVIVSREDKPLSISLSITGNGALHFLMCVSCALPSFTVSVLHYPYWA